MLLMTSYFITIVTYCHQTLQKCVSRSLKDKQTATEDHMCQQLKLPFESIGEKPQGGGIHPPRHTHRVIS